MPCFECCLLIIHDWYTLNHFDITCVKDVVFLMGIGVSFVTNKLAKYKKTKKFLAHLSRVRYLGVRYLGLQVHFSLQETHPHQPLHQVLILHYQLIQERSNAVIRSLTRRAYNICSPEEPTTSAHLNTSTTNYRLLDTFAFRTASLPSASPPSWTMFTANSPTLHDTNP